MSAPPPPESLKQLINETTALGNAWCDRGVKVLDANVALSTTLTELAVKAGFPMDGLLMIVAQAYQGWCAEEAKKKRS